MVEICLHQTLITYIKDKQKVQTRKEWDRTFNIPGANTFSCCILLELYFHIFILPRSLIRAFSELSSCDISNTAKHSKKYEILQELSHIRHQKSWDCYLGSWKRANTDLSAKRTPPKKAMLPDLILISCVILGHIVLSGGKIQCLFISRYF